MINTGFYKVLACFPDILSDILAILISKYIFELVPCRFYILIEASSKVFDQLLDYLHRVNLSLKSIGVQ